MLTAIGAKAPFTVPRLILAPLSMPSMVFSNDIDQMDLSLLYFQPC